MNNNPKGHPETLTPFPPGVSGNPAGKPKHKPIADAMRHLIQSGVIKRTKKGKSFVYTVDLPEKPRAIDYLAATHLEAALNGDNAARRELYDRTEGKIAQPIVGSDDPSDPPVQMQTLSAKEVARILGNVVMNAEYDRQEKEEAEKNQGK